MHTWHDTNGQKSWCFPKFHMLQHSFSSFQAKGVPVNTSTKPGKCEHLWIRKVFRSSNCKNTGRTVQIVTTLSLSWLIVYYFLDCHIWWAHPHTWHDTRGCEGGNEHRREWHWTSQPCYIKGTTGTHHKKGSKEDLNSGTGTFQWNSARVLRIHTQVL